MLQRPSNYFPALFFRLPFRQMHGVLLQGIPLVQAHRGPREGHPAVREPLHRLGEADEEVQGPETLLLLLQSGGG